jgi:RNA polymerase-binding transcription factor DksA
MAADAERDQLLDTIETDLADVELALARLDADSYFTCQRCGRPLLEALLAARPTARTCCE